MFKKCPYCQLNIMTVNIKKMPMYDEGGTQGNGVVYVCSNIKCNSILSAGIDPIALKTDTVNEVIEKLKKPSLY